MANSNILKLIFERESGGRLNSRFKTITGPISQREKELQDWVTVEAIKNCYSETCILNNVPRSTISAVFNDNGTLIASTHGDHTVKILDFESGKIVKQLEGHSRTPWTVRFHPTISNFVVSGSLDCEVKLWNIDTTKCLQSKNFGKQVSSISFHPSGKALAISAGHKIFIWEFDEENEIFSEKSCILNVDRTIRAVHFHAIDGRIIMASEKVEANIAAAAMQQQSMYHQSMQQQSMHPPPLSSQSSMNVIHNYHQQMGNIRQNQNFHYTTGRYVISPPVPESSPADRIIGLSNRTNVNRRENTTSITVDNNENNSSSSNNNGSDVNSQSMTLGEGYMTLVSTEAMPEERFNQNNEMNIENNMINSNGNNINDENTNISIINDRDNQSKISSNSDQRRRRRRRERRSDNHTYPSLQILSSMQSIQERQFNHNNEQNQQSYNQHNYNQHSYNQHNYNQSYNHNHEETYGLNNLIPRLRNLDISVDRMTSNVERRLGANIVNNEMNVEDQNRNTLTSIPQINASGGNNCISAEILHNSNSSQNHYNVPRPLMLLGNNHQDVNVQVPRININPESLHIARVVGESQIPSIESDTWEQNLGALTMIPIMPSPHDIPCITNLVLYEFDINDVHRYLNKPKLIIHGAVICSEMSTHISPCGRMLAVCIATNVPYFYPSNFNADVYGNNYGYPINNNSNSNNMPPNIACHIQYKYEIKIFSLESHNFGSVLRSKQISAGHCLTSVQFSPGSDMLLLSYGKRHTSLLRSLISDNSLVAHIHTILEIYSVSNLSLVRVLHSSEDEANTACFHPFAGEGILYGTKNGKVKLLRSSKRHMNNSSDGNKRFESELVAVNELDD